MSTNNDEIPCDAQGKPLSKKQLKKLAAKKKKEALKQQRALERQKKEEEARKLAEANDVSKGLYGVAELNQSQKQENKVFTRIEALDGSLVDKEVLVRARVANIRGQGNLLFIMLRQKHCTVQAIISKGDKVSKLMLQFVQKITTESIVDIIGKVTNPPNPIESATQKVEVEIQQIFVVSAAAPQLPIQLQDCERPEPLLEQQRAELKKIKLQIEEVEKQLENAENEDEKKALTEKIENLEKEKENAVKYVDISRKKKLDNRIIDLRATTNQAIFRIQHAVCSLFREFLSARGFTEIHTPKLIGAASESGAAVFSTAYFNDQTAYLAQSPQLYKQMCIASDFEKVFEIAPVFRRENSRTHRHMNEFIGLDLEMAFNEHYHEVLNTIAEMFCFIFDGINERFASELETIQKQYPFEPLKYKYPPLYLKWPEAIQLLRDHGNIEIGDFEDIDTTNEKLLGKIIHEQYDTDFYIIDKFPLNIRPFYTMPDPEDPRYSNSYDIFIRGEEVLSGAQRVHDYKLLQELLQNHEDVDQESIKDYINAFKYGCPPHAGGGVGLERVVMLFLKLSNIRLSSLFPRTPARLFP